MDLSFSAAQIGKVLNGWREALATEELSDEDLELLARTEPPAEAEAFNGEYTKITRLRRQGSGSRFVHGGASLQEVVVPVVKINKKRQSDTAAVEVEIIGGTSQMITSSQISVRFYQVSQVTDKTQARRLRAGLYAQSGDVISDSHDLVFDFRSKNPREREVSVRFLLSRQAEAYNGQEVILKLEERHGETSHFREYRTARYILRRSFSSDFDF